MALLIAAYSIAFAVLYRDQAYAKTLLASHPRQPRTALGSKPRSGWLEDSMRSRRAPFCPSTPRALLSITFFYYDQRIHREGYDIEHMMEAAGLNPTAPPVPDASLPVPITRTGQA
jgi:hypothetical protein